MKQGNVFLLVSVLFLLNGSIFLSAASFENTLEKGKALNGWSAVMDEKQLPETYGELLNAAQIVDKDGNRQPLIDCQPSSNEKGCYTSAGNCAKCCCESGCAEYLFAAALFALDKAYFLGFCL